MPTTSRPYDLAVAYRIYPRVSQTPVLHADSKYDLAELCLRSFTSALVGLRAKLWVLLDGCPPEYEDLFRSRFPAADLELVRLNGVGNVRTFETQLEILATQDDAEAVYLAEDDYLYVQGALQPMLAFLHAHGDAHFVSPYDHLDYYTLPFHQHPSLLRAHGGCHWRTVNSTCLTFLTTRAVLEETRHVFGRYDRVKLDCSLWLSLTKQRVTEPSVLMRSVRRDPFFFLVLRKAWRHLWRQILWGPTFRLWVPIPALATHLEHRFLAPGRDWKTLAASLEQGPATGGGPLTRERS